MYGGGYIYVFSLLYKLTDHGKNIFVRPISMPDHTQRAQVIFYLLYLFETVVVMHLYELAITKGRTDRKVTGRECIYFLLLAASRRLHSIFILRCFNDCFAVTFTYLAIYCLMRNRAFLCLVLMR